MGIGGREKGRKGNGEKEGELEEGRERRKRGI